jgi:hypothetical protein
LKNLTANRYANLWVYACPCNGGYAVLYPQNQYSNSASAEAESVPTTIPLTLRENGILIGRITIQQGTAAPVGVSSAFDTQFTPVLATDHGNLAGLADDDHTQYALADGTRGDFLKLDQTTPQEIVNGMPIFTKGLVVKAGERIYFDG